MYFLGRLDYYRNIADCLKIPVNVVDLALVHRLKYFRMIPCYIDGSSGLPPMLRLFSHIGRRGEIPFMIRNVGSSCGTLGFLECGT